MRSADERRPVSRLVMACALALLWLGSCERGTDDLLDRACRVIVEDCGRGQSVSECIDAMAGETPACMSCVAESACQFAQTCSQGAVRCQFPDAYVTLERVDGGIQNPRDGAPQDAGGDAD